MGPLGVLCYGLKNFIYTCMHFTLISMFSSEGIKAHRSESTLLPLGSSSLLSDHFNVKQYGEQ